MFRRLWLAQVVSNLGTWMQMVGAQWVVFTASGSAALVSLVQTASTAPVVLLAAPAGVLADVLDRRRVLVTVQVAMVAVAAVLAGLTFAGVNNPAVILAFTFLLGCGAAFIAPAWPGESIRRRRVDAGVRVGRRDGLGRLQQGRRGRAVPGVRLRLEVAELVRLADPVSPRHAHARIRGSFELVPGG
jgi:hypothetical protein